MNSVYIGSLLTQGAWAGLLVKGWASSKKLDLFITVSNSTAHLAASLGVKTWIIKPKNHAVSHYWNQPDNSTPWYESVKLYNYKGDWSITVQEIKRDLEKKFI